MTEPKKINAGDSASWEIDQGDYTAVDGWAVGYSVVNSAQQYTVDGAAVVESGSNYKVTIAAAVSAGWTVGDYRLIGYATKTGERVVFYDQAFRVDPDFTAAGDRRSKAQRMLDAVEAMIEGKANTDQQSMSINGRSLARYSWADLMPIRSQLKREVARESSKKGRVLTRFK